jgi:hypothetical protein
MNLAFLKPSAVTDLAQLITFVRPAIRTQVAGVPPESVRRLAWQLRCFAAIDSEGFVVFSRRQTFSSKILTIDRSAGDHTYVLGRLLGYPACCCRAAALIGDHGLDAWAVEIASRRFIGRFKAINPGTYQDGGALVSHVPCSERCLPSLSMALAFKARLIQLPSKSQGVAAVIMRTARAYRARPRPSPGWLRQRTDASI